MPAVSKKQRRLFAIAKHHPEQLHARNRDVAQASPETMDEYASTSERHLPLRKRMRRKHG